MSEQTMTPTERLRWIRAILGLLPSPRGWEGRATYWAFLIAGEASEEEIAAAQEQLEALRPGQVDRVTEFVKDGEVSL